MAESNLEGTTMEYIARLLYDLDGDFLGWEELNEQNKHRYRKIAVRIIDTAEPVWRKRTEHLYYEYLPVNINVPTERWPHLLATNIPLNSREEAWRLKEQYEQEYGGTYLVLRKLRGSEWMVDVHGA